MDLINRYVYAVTKSLPEKQRGDIEKELKALINDMVEENDGPESYEEKVKSVLLELGNPEILADNYRGTKRYLIGPQYYDKYILVLKIVLGAVFAGISIAVIVGSIVSSEQNIVKIFSDYFAAVFSGLLQAFVWTTIGFAVAERNSLNESGNSKKDEWNLKQLPQMPVKKAMISPVESIVSIIFSTIFIAILYFSPELFAAYIPNNEGVTVIPIFDLEVLKAYRVMFICIFIISVFRETLKLFSRRWTFKLSVAFTVLSIVSTALMVIIFTNPGVWNASFPSEIALNTNIDFNFSNLWDRLRPGFIIVMIAACILDISQALYKGIKYNAV